MWRSSSIPDDFAAGVQRLASEGYVGVNVTIPHKEAALAVAGEASAAAREIGAANTLSFGPGAIRADNTDATGLTAALPVDPAGMRALVLGAGGSARAAAWALAGAGADVTVHNRTHSRALELAAEIGVRAIASAGDISLGDYDLLVNATSIGLQKTEGRSMKGASPLKALGLGVDGLGDRMVVVDLVYGAEPTDLIEAARRMGPPSSKAAKSWFDREPSRSASGPAWNHHWKRCEKRSKADEHRNH